MQGSVWDRKLRFTSPSAYSFTCVSDERVSKDGVFKAASEIIGLKLYTVATDMGEFEQE